MWHCMLFGCGLFACWSLGAFGAERLTAPTRIPVLAWIGPPEKETTLERYKELADAGFTHNFSMFSSLAAMDQAMEVAKAAGIKQFICCPELEKDPEGVATHFREHPALAGYHLKDEPGANEFAALAKWAKRIQAVDSKHWCYINLFPTYASSGQLHTKTYQEHVTRFLAEVPTEALSYDHYPITGNSLRPDYYENLEIAAKAAREAKKPLWAFTLSVGHGSYPVPKLEHLRLQLFSDLAYGAFGLQYFTYWTPVDKNWNFHQAPIEVDGKKTPVYDLVKAMNKEIEGLAGVFVGSEVQRLGHTGTPPKGTQAFVAAAPIERVTTEGQGALVSLLAQKQRRFLVLVNRDFNAAMPLTVAFDPSAQIATVDKTGALQPLPGKEFKTNVDKGDLVVLTWVVK